MLQYFTLLPFPSSYEELRGWTNFWPWLMWCYSVRRWTDGRATLFSLVDSHIPFPVGLKSIATSQWSASNSCFVSRLNSRGPEPQNLPLLWCGLRGEEHGRLFSIHFVIKNRRRGRVVERRVGRFVKRCVASAPVQLPQQREEQGDASFSNLIEFLNVLTEKD